VTFLSNVLLKLSPKDANFARSLFGKIPIIAAAQSQQSSDSKNKHSIVLVRVCECPIDLIFSVLKRESNPTDGQITSFLIVIKIC
jgi:hypothetical protein